jgi:hypothetical protein
MNWLDTPEGRAAVDRANERTREMVQEFRAEMARRLPELLRQTTHNRLRLVYSRDGESRHEESA